MNFIIKDIFNPLKIEKGWRNSFNTIKGRRSAAHQTGLILWWNISK